MLHPVAQLREHAVGDVERVLRHEVHAHALAAHQPHHQLDALDQRGRCLLEQQMGLVEEKHQLGLIEVAHLGQLLEQLGEHPQQEGGIQPRAVHQLVGRQDIDDASARLGLHEVGDVEHGLAEEAVAALLVDLQQAALDGANAGRAHVAVLGGELAGVVAHVLKHRAQVLQIEQQHAVVVGDLEHQAQHALLRLIECQHAREHQRAHVAHGGAHRVALRGLAAGAGKHIPQHGRAGDGFGCGQAAFFQHAGELVADAACLRDAGQVALHVGHEHRHADAAEVLGQRLQGDRLAGAGGAGDQPVAVGQFGQQVALDVAMLGNQDGLGHERAPEVRAGAGWDSGAGCRRGGP